QRSRQILFTNRLTGLLGGPGRKRTPVGVRSGARGHCCGQFVIALRNLQVAKNWVSKLCNSLNVRYRGAGRELCGVRHVLDELCRRLQRKGKSPQTSLLLDHKSGAFVSTDFRDYEGRRFFKLWITRYVAYHACSKRVSGRCC